MADADGVRSARSIWRGAPAAVLVFVAVDCPISNGYAPELQRIMADEPYPPACRFYLVYADPTTTPAAAKAHAAAYGYTCPLSCSTPGTCWRPRVGATVTPEGGRRRPTAGGLY